MYLLIRCTTIVEAPDYTNLRAAWKHYGRSSLVAGFIVRKPLTAAQLRRLPNALKEMLEYTKAAPRAPKAKKLPGYSNVFILPVRAA